VTAPPRPLSGLRFVLVGPGRVGETLATWAVARGAECVAVAGRAGSERTPAVASRLRAAPALALDLDPADAELTLVAVPDSQLLEAARRLAGRVRGVVLHVSGIFGASALGPLESATCATGAFHPLRAFAAVEPDPERARGTFFALDGAPEARALGRRLATAFGGTAGVVPEDARPLYHLAATLAAGGVATLLACAHRLAADAGVPEAARAGYGELARGALEAALAAENPAEAITGPVARGDLETVERHLEALAAANPRFRPLVVALARATLDRIAEIGLPDPSRRALAERLDRPDLLDRTRDPVLTSKSPV